MKTESTIKRRVSRQVMVGNVPVGGDAPIAVQSMTNTETCDVAATVAQIKRLEDVGADIVRVSVPSMDAADAFGEIRKLVNVPLVADIHFDYKIALKVAELGVDCLRINPGNIGNAERVKAVVGTAKDKNIPIRIGVNAGSLGKDLLRKYKEPNATAMIESAMRNIELLDKEDFHNFKLSLKASDIFMTIEAYQGIASQIDQPLHLGITEAGGLRSGTVKSAAGLGMLLMQDFLAIFVLLLLISDVSGTSGLLQFGQSLIALPLLIGGSVLAVRWILQPLFARFDRIGEYIFLLAIGWCLGVAELAETAGLSREIGAFIAGISIATSPIAQYIALNLKPLRDFFLILFFFSLGGGFDLSLIPHIIVPALVLAAVMLGLKPVSYTHLTLPTNREV